MMYQMRTTLTLDCDVAQKAKALTAQSGKSFKSVINEALRAGFDQIEHTKPRRKPFRTKPFKSELREGISIDNIGELLARVEGEDYR